MTDRIPLSTDADMAEARFNRPKKMNTIDPAMFGALVTVGKRLMNEAGLRTIALFGEGHAFYADLDMGSMASLGSNDTGSDISTGRLARHVYGAANLPQYVYTVRCDLPVPALTAMHGIAYGGGLQIALGVDMRYVAADTRLSVMETKWGLVPGMGGMMLTRGLVRPDRLRELIYSGRVVSGKEVFVLGLATHAVDDPRAAALAAARGVTLKSPDIIRAGKCPMRITEDGDATTTLLAESVGQDRLIGTDDQHGVVLIDVQNRAPVPQPAAESEQKLKIAWSWQLRR